MYKREKTKEQIYVLRSADETTTKIGRSHNPDIRVDSICISERKTYYLLYRSKPLLKEEAIQLEKEVIEHFKDDCIKGKEWISTHPLDVIRFIVEKIGKDNKKEIYLNDLAYHYCFVSTSAKYNSITFKHLNGVKIDSNYYAYVKTIYSGQFIVLGFSNIKDAYDYIRKNKHLQRVIPIVTELLFGKTYKEWTKENTADYKTQNWLLL